MSSGARDKKVSLGKDVATWTAEGYQRQWHHPFPQEAHGKLKQAPRDWCARRRMKAFLESLSFSSGAVLIAVLSAGVVGYCASHARHLYEKFGLSSCPSLSRTVSTGPWQARSGWG